MGLDTVGRCWLVWWGNNRGSIEDGLGWWVDIGAEGAIMRMIGLGLDLCGKLLFCRWWHMERGVHAKSGLGGARSTGSIGGLGVLALSSLLKCVEVGDADTSSRLAVHGTLDESSIGHVRSWCRALVPREARAVGISLALLTRRTCQAGQVRLFGYHCLGHG
jgi:hypothetical protein